MSHANASPGALMPAADVADSVLTWAEDAAIRFLERDRGAAARDALRQVAQGRSVLRFTFSGSVHRCVLALRIVEVGSGRAVRVPLPYCDELPGELSPVFLGLLHMLRMANQDGRGRVPGRLRSLIQSAQAGSGGIVFRIDFRGGFAYFEAVDLAERVWMRALCLRVGPSGTARPVVH